MKFGLTLANMGPTAHRESLLGMARLGQELEFDSIWVGDHVFIPYNSQPLYPYSASGRFGVQPQHNLFDPLVTLAYMAGVVETPMLGVGVLVAPYRNPVLTAKMLATLDVLSGGRLVFGAGVGWNRDEFDALEASYPDRGKVTDEYVQIFKELCTTDRLDFRGEHYQLSNVAFYPRPVQKPHPPVWVGGYSLSALRRTVRLGDAWFPSNIDPLSLAGRLATLRHLCQEAGRDPESIEIAVQVNNIGFGDAGSEEDGHVVPLKGTPEQMREKVTQYEDVGVTHLVLGMKRTTIEEMVRTTERFADEVRAKL